MHALEEKFAVRVFHAKVLWQVDQERALARVAD